MSEFKVGEVAILCYNGPYNGVEVVITGPLSTGVSRFSHFTREFHSNPSYPISGDVPFGYAQAIHLRKKRPPQELSSWARIHGLTHWHPESVPA